MKTTELEDWELLATKADLRDLHQEIRDLHQGLREEFLAMRKDISDLREEVRHKWWIPVLVSVGTMLVTGVGSPVLVYLLTHR